MASTRLQIYNDALQVCGERMLLALTENRPPRFYLDNVWNNNGVNHCLEKGMWTFATRTSMLTPNPSLAPSFGYRQGYNKPVDWTGTVAMCSDEYFKSPLVAYEDEAAIWFADIEPIYVRYVSNDPAYGQNLALWPSYFADYVSAHFAAKIVKSLTGDKAKRDEVAANEITQLRNASNMDMKQQPTRFPAEGSWNKSRYGRLNWRDGGNRGQLYG